MFHRRGWHQGHPAFAGGGPHPGAGEHEAHEHGHHAAHWGRRSGPPWLGWLRHGFGPGHGRGGFPFGPGHGRGGFPGGPGSPWWARRGFGGGPGPRFGRGDLKYELLALLAERPMHGYEMIKALEEQAGGFYTPSAGAVYPSLQLMEDRGWVTSQTVDGKKVYTIADAGREALAQQRGTGEQQRGAGEQPHGPFGGRRHGGGPGWFGQHGPRGREVPPELMALGQDSREVTMLLFNAVMSSGGDPAKLARLREIVANTRRALQDYLGQSTGEANTTRLDPDKGREPSDLI